MFESTKSLRRRYGDGAFHSRFLVGNGIDIGGGEDPLSKHVWMFARVQSVRSWDLSDGDAQAMAGVPDGHYDFVYSSHCLEHLRDPVVGLENWLRILKPGGHLIVTVPDEDLYEQGIWPSRHNSDHKWSFTIHKSAPTMPRSIGILDLVRLFGNQVNCERISLVRDFYREGLGDVDQTTGPAECAIEFVWRKRGDVAQALLAQGEESERRERPLDAAAAYRAAIASDPQNFAAWHRLSLLLCREREYDAVEALWAQCVERMASSYLPRLYQALFILSLGQYQRGFRLRDACVPDERRSPLTPPADCERWQGQDLRGRSIVIWTEFGFGDEIMFSRFVAVFKHALGARRVSVVVQAPLLGVVSTLADADAVVSDVAIQSYRDRGGAAPLLTHDFWIFPHSIGSYAHFTPDMLAAPVPYLSAPHERRDTWRSELERRDDTHALRVGLVWEGNPTHENDALRSMPGLYLLEPLFGVAGVAFITLQKGSAEDEVAEYLHRPISIRAYGQQLGDFADTAAVLVELDLLITVDTSAAHLAGALGVPTWLMLPTLTDWRWLLDRNDSPWYPSMRIFRQQRTGEWASVISAVRRALEERVAGAHPGHKSEQFLNRWAE